MEHAELTRKIDAYLEENWETMVEDIETLVRIPSFEESDKATEGAPFVSSILQLRWTPKSSPPPKCERMGAGL